MKWGSDNNVTIFLPNSEFLRCTHGEQDRGSRLHCTETRHWLMRAPVADVLESVWGGWRYSSSILLSALDRVDNFRSRQFHYRGIKPPNQLSSRLGWAPDLIWVLWRREKSLSPEAMESRYFGRLNRTVVTTSNELFVRGHAQTYIAQISRLFLRLPTTMSQ
jgi:hypothetical protein